ncbi:MAG: AbrB/MazE/SpoVT family DNA-binding domain-containing protein [Candidatus Aenigmarchaeota archaeon]|nr:AbrB/MazE/SpoVT family DNA-binding domain-containing protein [Candidatus Aenigmarchaeota archaeon]
MSTEVEVRRIGNSLGVILPKEFVRQKGIKADEKILIEVVKEADLRDVFGMLKRRRSGQEFKDMIREGWE